MERVQIATHITKLFVKTTILFLQCSTHFEGGKKSIDHPVPTIFPWSRKAVKDGRTWILCGYKGMRRSGLRGKLVEAICNSCTH